MRGRIQFLVFQKIAYLLILFVTDVLFVGKFTFLKTFIELSIFVLLFLFFQNNRVITDPNSFQMLPKYIYFISQYKSFNWFSRNKNWIKNT